MMRSMFSGVSGLRAHQTKMDVIGNNVANVNTIGFKSARVTFQEVFSQTLKGSSAPDSNSGRGGTNPMQVGLGIGVGAVDTMTTRGSAQRTDNPTDLSIEGDGFFIVKNGKADAYKFTRAGNFGLDKFGNLVLNGAGVYGWQDYGGKPDNNGSYNFDTEKPLEPINIYSDDHNKNKKLIPAQPTSEVRMAGNLDATKTALGTSTSLPSQAHFSVPMTVFDTLGNSYSVNVKFYKMDSVSAASGASGSTSWYWMADAASGGASGSFATASSSSAGGFIKFDTQGSIISGSSSNVTPAIQLQPASSIGGEPVNIKLDFSKLTMYSADSKIDPTVDGYQTGSLVTLSIGSDGIISGIYNNGKQRPLGMVALANFENPAGLQKVGDNMYIPSTNSGDFLKGYKAGSGSVGALNAGTLEMSNVDLSREFTDMIITQRGFQANSRIVTTSDEMLQELVNLKR